MGTKTRTVNPILHLYPVILCIAVFITYVWSLPNGFISDDLNAIVLNGAIQSVQTITAHPLSFIQPLLLVILSSIAGTNPGTAWVYRSVNILFHAGSVFFLYFIVRKITNETTGFLTGLLYAVHPAVSESVMWISAGNYVRYGFFFFASLYAYMQWKDSHRFRDYVIHVGLCILCLESSEKGIILFLLFAAYELFVAKQKSVKVVIPTAILSIVYAGLYLRYLPARLDFIKVTDTLPTSNNPFIQVPVVIWMYIRLIFWPRYLDIFHSMPFISVSTYVFGIMTSISFLLICYISYRYNRRILFFLFLFLIPLIPVLTPLRIASFFAERYAYISIAGMIAGISYGIHSFAIHIRNQKIIYGIFGIVIILLMARTIVRAADLRSDDTLAQSGMRDDPNNIMHQENYANMLMRNNQLDTAASFYKEILQHNPQNANAHTNLGYIYAHQGNMQKAINEYTKANHINPNIWELNDNMAAYYAATNDNRRAIAFIQKALQLNASNTTLMFHAAIVYYLANNFPMAKYYINLVYTRSPNNPDVKYYYDLIYR